MKHLSKYSLAEGRAVLVSIHPGHAEKIISREKRLEFRRCWTRQSVDILVIYATSPVKLIVAVAQVRQVVIGSKGRLWELAKDYGGCITREELFTYLDGKISAVAIELTAVQPIAGGLDPTKVFGNGFRPPQSFRYLKKEEYLRIGELIRAGNGRYHGHGRVS